eukprot:UN10504
MSKPLLKQNHFALFLSPPFVLLTLIIPLNEVFRQKNKLNTQFAVSDR